MRSILLRSRQILLRTTTNPLLGNSIFASSSVCHTLASSVANIGASNGCTSNDYAALAYVKQSLSAASASLSSTSLSPFSPSSVLRHSVYGFLPCFYNWGAINNDGSRHHNQVQKRAIASSNKKNQSKKNENAETKESNKSEPSIQEDATVADEAKKSVLSTLKSPRLWKSSAEAFDLSPPPIPLKRSAQLTRLQLNLSRIGSSGRNQQQKKSNNNTTTSAKLASATSSSGCVNLLNYTLSYYPPELRHQDIERYIEQESWKRLRKEQEAEENEKIQQEKLKAKTTEKAKRSNEWVKTFKLAVEIQKKEDTEMNRKLAKMKEEDAVESELIKAIQKESNFVPGINNFADQQNDDIILYQHPFQIKWDYYCQAHNDWQRRLDQFYHVVMGKSTRTNLVILAGLYGLVLYYAIAGIFTTVYYKYSLVIRYQLMFSAGILSYCGGTIWGHGIGNRFLISRLKKSPAMAFIFMVMGSTFSLWAAGFDYDLGFIMMDTTCALSILGLYWMRHRGVAQSWYIRVYVPLLTLCIVAMLIDQYRAAGLKATAGTAVDTLDLEDYLSITSVVKAIVPKRVKQILFKDETEIVAEDFLDNEDIEEETMEVEDEK